MTKTSGVYLIINSVNGKLYVGSAANIYSRFSWHYRYLELGKHHSILLQRAVNKYGIDNFIFAIVEETKDLLTIEQKWLDASKSYLPEFGYNIYKIAGSPKGFKHTEEWKLNNSKLRKGKKLSEETKAKMRAYQMNRTNEHKANHLVATSKPRIFTKEHRQKIADAMKRRGNSYLTEEIRLKMSLAQKERAGREGRNVL